MLGIVHSAFHIDELLYYVCVISFAIAVLGLMLAQL